MQRMKWNPARAASRALVASEPPTRVHRMPTRASTAPRKPRHTEAIISPRHSWIHWDQEQLKTSRDLKDPSLTKAIIRCYWKPYAVLGIFVFIEEVIMVLQPVLLGYLVGYLESYDPADAEGLQRAFYLATGISLCTILQVVIHHPYFFHVEHLGMKIRVALCHMIYKKTTTGQIVNLLSNDVNKFDHVTILLHYLWVGPLQAAAAVGILWNDIGPSSLSGMAVLLFLMPLQTLFGRLFSKFRSQTAVLTDSRIRTMNEVVSGIRIIKMYAWEKPFNALVSDVRRKVIVSITFVVYVLLGNTITASQRSSSRSSFESRVSVKRIPGVEAELNGCLSAFLLLDEVPKATAETLCQDKEASVEIQDLVCYWDKGNVVAQGGYTELQMSGLDFTSLLKKEEEEEQMMSEGLARSRTLSSTSTPSVNDAADMLPAEPIQTLAEESRLEGTIGMGLYFKYLRAGANVLIVLLLIVLFISAQLAYVLTDWWLSYWSEQQEALTDNATSFQNHSSNATQQLDLTFYLGVYGGLTATTLFLGFARALLFFNILVKSSEVLHSRMFHAILRTPVLFFDVNPIGRVLNRFTKDIGQLDTVMPWTFFDAIQAFLHMVGVIAVAASVIPWILLLVFPLLLVFIFLRRYFLQTSRDIKRLEATTRSPVFSHLSSSLQGLWTIRAFKAQERFQNLFDAHQDLHSESWFLFLTTSRWFAMRLDIMCGVFVTITTFSCVLLRDELGAGDVGLALTYAITLMGMFQWGVRQSAEVEMLMTSVERVAEYTELESEAPWETQKRPPPDWPSQGMVTFDGVNFSYSADGPLVLRNMNATFLPREKVGVVGRTGAGKSSLVSALFRLAEPQGRIYVDGVLTSEIGLHDLRQKMSIIPQMTSVERVAEYTELESEAPWETQKRPPTDWPSQGMVTFDGVNFSYSADGPLVLRNMNATFLPREKVGVVGRTGAGKSSLVSALFRLAEPQGRIYVDGVLTSEIGLHDLRQKMSIIPQDPVLFTGTMRKNLDPFSHHTDEELWNALQEASTHTHSNTVQLKSAVEEMPGKMETVLAESGSNFSVGQRQLVCLARAILRKNRVLIIDEATANRTIRDKFRDCTVLTIAHRLNTIIDSDRILVLDAGEIQAYDEPYALLQDPHGIFSKMVQQSGKQEAADLRASAKQKDVVHLRQHSGRCSRSTWLKTGHFPR
ncbi:hypothetical protein CRUP_024784, partial [Coryphaenoides rupestris]